MDKNFIGERIGRALVAGVRLLAATQDERVGVTYGGYSGVRGREAAARPPRAVGEHCYDLLRGAPRPSMLSHTSS